MGGIVFGEGLVGIAVHPDVDPTEGLLIDDSAVEFLEALGEGFPSAPNRLLGLPQDGPEWARVRAAVYYAYMTADIIVTLAQDLSEGTVELRERIDVASGASEPS